MIDENISIQLNKQQCDHAFQTFFMHSGNGIAILKPIEQGSDFVITEINPVECRFGSRTREELVGMKVKEAYPQTCRIGMSELLRQVHLDGKTRHFDPVYYQDERIRAWVKGYICKLPGNQLMATLEDVTSEMQRHLQQELELTILSKLRNTNQLEKFIPEILTQITQHLHASHTCLYLKPEYRTAKSSTCENCIWSYCDDPACTSKSPTEICGDLHAPHYIVLEQSGDPQYSFFTQDGSFWFKDLEKLQQSHEFIRACPEEHIPLGRFTSGGIVALRSGDEILGLLQVISDQPYAVNEKQVEFLEVIGAGIGMALSHQHAEIQLRINEQKMRTILDSMPAMLAAFDPAGNIIYWNKECSRISGYSTEEAINNPNISKLLFPDPDYRKSLLHRIRKNEQDFSNEVFCFTNKSGAECITSWSNISNRMPVPGWHIWVVGQDVTRAKRSDRVLQGVLNGTARETGTLFFRTLAKNLAQTLGVKYAMISEILPDHPDSCGTRAVWAGDDFIDNFVYEIKDTPCAKVAQDELCICERNVAREFPKTSMLVEMGIESYAGIRLLDAEENLLGILAIMDTQPLQEVKLIRSILKIFSTRAASELDRQHAVEEQQRLETQLRQSHKMEAVGQLAGGIAHDFNNLLQAISGYTELATYTLPADHSAHDDLKQVQHAASRASDLVQQLLSFSSRQVLHPQILQINEVIQSTSKMIRRVIGEQIELEFALGKNIHPIRADRGQLDQIIINLCVNARDAMPNGGKLSIHTFPFTADESFCHNHNLALPGQYTCISIADTGTGMPSDIKEHIFEPFFSTKGLGKGSGLGLSSVFGIVAQHKGFIDVDSAPSVGTIFNIHLPVTETEKKQKKEIQLAIPLEEGNGTTILFAEDEEVVRNLCTTLLEKSGYKVLTAKNGEKAIDLFHEHKDEISFAVLDVIMPRMSGPEVCKIIRADRPELPVLFATGYSFNLLENDIPHAGCEIISKPFSPRKLLKTISDMLGEKTPESPAG